MKHTFILLAVFIACNQGSVTKRESDRQHDGFVGPVKKVFVIWSPISGSTYPVGSRCRQLTNEYDESGRLIRHSVYPGDCGSDEIRDDYSYSQDGSQTAKTQEIRGTGRPSPPPPAISRSNADDDMGQSRRVFKYDPLGRLLETAMVKAGGRLSYKNTFSYDAKGRLSETVGYDGDSQITDRRVYSYSGDERVPSGFSYHGRDGKVYERTTYTDYEFNSHGDWLKRRQTTVESFNRVSVSMMIREIEYYPNKK